MPKISDPNVTRLINNNEIQPIVCPTGQELQKHPWMQKKNPSSTRLS
jgi:large subunit ribosomal protein L4e